MDDLAFGTRNKRGDWKPNEPVALPPMWRRPFSLPAVLKWIPGYLFPWNAFHLATALLYWRFVIPDVETMKTLYWGWALWLYVANGLCIFVMYGSIELFYYVRRKQGTRFKYNAKFPADAPSDVFWFKSQNLDNFLRTYLFGIPMWTLVEVLMLWAFANGYVPWLAWADNPYWLAVLILAAPVIHDVHFFLIHRAIHWGPLYRWIHSVHHNSINPSPWSSLSMHPVETFVYHGVALWHLLIPSNPVVALFQLHIAGFGAVNGHIGFDKLEVSDDRAFDSHAYIHYLHHKFFEVNYGGDGLVPLDKWFGTWHDGSKDGEACMEERFRKKRERMNAKSQTV